jgi:hypothetical protein
VNAAPIRHGILFAAVFAVLATQSVAPAQGTQDAFVAKIPGQSMTSSVTLSLSSATGAPGQTLVVPINLAAQGTAAPATFQSDLSFDQTKLTFASAQAGTELTSAGKTLSASVLAGGNVRLLATGVNQTVISSGLVANVTFTLSPQFVSGGTVVALLNCASASGLGGALSTGCSGGTIQSQSCACDINADGVVNVADVQLEIDEALGVIPAVNDIGHYGAVNVADVQIVINAALGLGCPY